MKVAAIVVLYYAPPEANELIRSLSETITQVIVIDNGGSAHIHAAYDNVVIKREIENQGLARAQRTGLEYANASGANAVLFFDQDTQISRESIKTFIGLGAARFEEDASIGAVAPLMWDTNSQTFGRLVHLSRFKIRITSGEEGLAHLTRGERCFATFAISSGSLWRMPTTIPDWFIDHLDTAACLSLAVQQKRLEILPVVINHQIGQRRSKKILGYSFNSSNHSALRRYYIARNGIFCLRQFGLRVPSFAALLGLRMFYDVIGIMWLESDRWEKLRATLKGVAEGLTRSMAGAHK